MAGIEKSSASTSNKPLSPFAELNSRYMREQISLDELKAGMNKLPVEELIGSGVKVVEENAGLLGFGMRVAVVEAGKKTYETTIFGDTIHHLSLRNRAIFSGNSKAIKEATNLLPPKLR